MDLDETNPPGPRQLTLRGIRSDDPEVPMDTADTYNVADPPKMDEKQKKILKHAKREYDRCEKFYSVSRARQLDDLKFAEADSYNGYQWPNDIKNGRDLNHQPSLTINKTRQHNLIIINEAKKHKATMKFRPVGNEASSEAAEIWDAIGRHIEYQSNATDAYSLGIAFQVKTGFGAWRVTTKYVDDESFDQEIYILPVPDPRVVYIDPDTKQPDKSDMRFAFLFEDLPREVFNQRFPEFHGHAATTPLGISWTETWSTQDKIRICEYYRKITVKDILHSYVDPESGEMKAIPQSEMPKELIKASLADPQTRTRIIEKHKVLYYLIVGDTIVEEKVWPGKYIPIVPIIGEETLIDGSYDCKGHTRALLDSQRMFNYWAPVSLNTRIPVPGGWSTMGEIQTGDYVYDEKGFPVKVIGTSPIFQDKPCYEVEFDDGTVITASGDHKWTVEERGKRTAKGETWTTEVRSTEELCPRKHFIWQTKPIQGGFLWQKLPIHPYVLGLWLGDGDSAGGIFTSHFADVSHMSAIVEACGYKTGNARFYGDKTTARVTIEGLTTRLHDAGLLYNKHIPEIYLRAPVEDRLALLQGLMDTDGSIGANRQCSFTNKDDGLKVGFEELIRSLGLKAIALVRPAKSKTFPGGKVRTSEAHWQFSFSPGKSFPVFRLPRKLVIQMGDYEEHPRRKRHRIVAVRRTETVPVRCLVVDSESHLFLISDAMIPTHNSSAVEYGALQSKTPYIAPALAIEGLQIYWDQANLENYSVLPYNHLDDDGNPIPAPQRSQPPMAAPLYMEGMKQSLAELELVSGQYNNQMGQQGNERTGKAIQERQRQSDTATYHYVDGQAKAIRYTAKIIADLIPKIYDTKRVMQLMDVTGKSIEVTIDPDAQKAYQEEIVKDTQAIRRVLNPSIGKFDVQADVGPEYATRQEEAWDAFMQILTQSPQLVTLIGDVALRNANFPMSDIAADRLERMVPPQAKGIGPTPQEQSLMQQNMALKEQAGKLIDQLAAQSLKLTGKQEMRDIDAYEAQTKRFAALAPLLGTEPEEVQAVIQQLVAESLQTHIAKLVQSGALPSPGGGTPNGIPTNTPPIPVPAQGAGAGGAAPANQLPPNGAGNGAGNGGGGI